MTKGVLFIASVLMVLVLPNWLRNDQSSSQLVRNTYVSYVDISAIPASKTKITIAFDLGGVLLGIDTKKALDQMGSLNILKYMTQHKVSPISVKEELLKKVYEIFNTIQPGGNSCEAQDPYGNRMPAIMCDWQAGRKSNAELIAMVFHHIKQHPEWFTSSIEKELVESVIRKMFVPQLLASTITLIPEGLEYVKQCKKRGHTLMVLSNWDVESFELVKKKFPELFNLFDGVIVSGDTKQIKPEPAAYAFLVERIIKYDETVVFVDDQKENCQAASACGLKGIHYVPAPGFLGIGTKPNFEAVETYVSYYMRKCGSKKM
ncbi:MAG: HAD-IA family hydrolase [Candidatus Dependentiae bacterium]|nr:HAD-IA family hydrolase [Candidatus Dependentiae bacterium]